LHLLCLQVQQLRLHFFQSSLQRQLPQLAVQFPAIRRLSLSGCSALQEAWLQVAAEAWPVERLHVSGLWSWTGTKCLQFWAPTLTHLTADDTSFPLLSLVDQVPANQWQHATSDLGSNPASAVTAAAGSSAAFTVADETPQQPGQHQLAETSSSYAGSPASGRGSSNRQGRGHPSSSWLGRTGQLRELQLRRLVTQPVRCRFHGSS